MGVLLVGLLVLATQCPNGSSSLVAVLSASPTSGTSPLTVNFDASSSSGPDGSILTYEWSFGDGEAGTGETVSHTYRQPGINTAQLAVIDTNGNMDSTSCGITVTVAVGTPPSAGFTATPSSGEVPLAVNFNASASFDPDGSITSYAWSFGDGGNGSGATVTHTYTSAGTYYPLLCVTDDDGNQDYAAQTVHVLAPPGGNNPPKASFTASPTSGQAPLAVSFNASGSSDSDGSITSYAWSFGDGGSSSGVTASHTYTSAGTYTARLTVTDDDSSTDSVTRTIQVSSTPVANNPPTASFTASPTSGDAPLAVSFNSSGSSDSDGSITSYAWSFGDGGSSTGATTSHTYNSASTYMAQLTVTDDDGSTDTTTAQIEVLAPSGTEVGGMISSNAVWRREESPYVATTNVLVPDGVNLAIEPGTTVLFYPDVGMQIEGTLTANGTPSEPIVFAQFAEVWSGIEFLGSGSGSILDNCIFRRANCTLDLEGGNNIPSMSYLTIEECYYGVYSIGGYSTTAIKLSHCLITGSDTAVMLRIASTGSLTISDCTITGNRMGIRCIYSSGPVYINYNNITSNSAYNVEGATVIGGGQVDAANNWWGTTNNTAIEAGIYDKNDDLSYEVVTYSPILAEPHSGSPTP